MPAIAFVGVYGGLGVAVIGIAIAVALARRAQFWVVANDPGFTTQPVTSEYTMPLHVGPQVRIHPAVMHAAVRRYAQLRGREATALVLGFWSAEITAVLAFVGAMVLLTMF